MVIETTAKIGVTVARKKLVAINIKLLIQYDVTRIDIIQSQKHILGVTVKIVADIAAENKKLKIVVIMI